LVFWGLCVPASGQSENEIRIDNRLVMVPVAVFDRDGRHVGALRRPDFRVFEDGIEQSIDVFQSTENEISVYLLLDVSGSTAKFAGEIADAANMFVKQLRPTDEIGVASFAYDRRVLVDQKKVSAFADRIGIQVFPLDPGTLVYDAVDFAAKRLRKRQRRKAIVLFSDGVDTGIHKKLEQALRDAEEQDAAIYTIHYGANEPPTKFVDPNKYLAWQKDALVYMRSVAESTGGRYFQIEEIANLSQTFRSIAEELSRQYTLGYYPQKDGKKGERRRIKVTVNRPDAAVRSRTTYLIDR
jgi:Ca-activated chloride channel homolog